MELMLAMLMNLSSSLSESQKNSLDLQMKNLEAVYAEIPMEHVIDKNYFIAFNHQEKKLEEALATSTCLNPIDYSDISVTDLTKSWFNQIQKASTLGLQGRKRQQNLIKADRALTQIETILTGVQLQTCLDELYDYYSDGHTRTFVKVKDSSVLFAIEEGYPD